MPDKRNPEGTSDERPGASEDEQIRGVGDEEDDEFEDAEEIDDEEDEESTTF